MPSAANAVIGALRVEATLDAGKFVDGARKIRTESKQTEATVKSSFTGMGAAVKSGIAGFVGALSVGMFTQVIKSSLDYAGSLAEVAQQLGVTTRDLQTYRFMAGQVGVSQEQLETGLSKLTITLGKVAAGAQEPTKALAAIGLTAKDVANIDTGEAFRKIADGLQKVEDRSQRAAVEVALFGKSGSMLDNMLAGGSDRINELADAADRLGIVLSDEQIQRADDTADKLEALKTVLAAQIAGVVADNADSIYKLADSIAHLVGQIPGAIRQLKAFYANFLDFSANVTKRFDEAIEHPLNRLNPLAAPFRGGAMHANRIANAQGEQAEAHRIRQQMLGDALAAGIAARRSAQPRRSTGTISPFLAPRSRGGGSRRRGRSAPEDQSADAIASFQREQMQADADILRAKQQLSHSADERAKIDLQLIELDRKMQSMSIDEQVKRAEKDAAEGRITKAALQEVEAQAAILQAKNDEAARIRAQAVIEERIEKQQEAIFDAADQHRSFTIDALRAADAAATTAEDHRRIQLQILDAEIEQKRLELEHQKQLAVRNGATAEEIQVIQDKIDNLGAERAQGAAAVVRGTQGPLETYLSSIPHQASEITEAIQGIEVNALDGLINSITASEDAFKHLGQTVLQEGEQMALMFVRLYLKMLLFRALSSAMGLGNAAIGLGNVGGAAIGAPNLGALAPVSSGLSTPLPMPVPHFARGGGFTVKGMGGTDRNVLSMNGLPIAKVSYGERINVANDDGMGGNLPPPISVTNYNDFRGADANSVAAIQARLDRQEAELPYRVVQAYYDAVSRNVIR